jgi:pimeloyl-ACP methyl ester carboxylesterase
MVLVDATHEDVWIEFNQVLAAAEWEQFEALTVENPELLAAYPEAERLWRSPLIDDPNMILMRQTRAEAPLRPMPLSVLSHGVPFAAPFPGWPASEMEALMLALQDDLATLVPNARHVIAHRSGHDIHQDQPDLVIEEIRRVVDAVRDPDAWKPGLSALPPFGD